MVEAACIAVAARRLRGRPLLRSKERRRLLSGDGRRQRRLTDGRLLVGIGQRRRLVGGDGGRRLLLLLLGG